MKKNNYFLLFAFSFALILSCNSHSEKHNDYINNPLLRDANEIIDFSNITSQNIEEALTATIATSDKLIEEAINADEISFKKILIKLDEAYSAIYRVMNPFELIFSTHPDSIVRETARIKHSELSSYNHSIVMNERLFKKIQEFSETQESQSLQGEKKRFLKELLRKFKQGGLHLDKEKQEYLKKLKATTDRLGNQYRQNIDASNELFEITNKDTAGLEKDFLDARKTEKGTYEIDMSKPSYTTFMKFCPNDSLRKEIQKIYNNRATPVNLAILDSLLYYRHEMAALLGYNSFADYALADRMAQTPDNVWNFINNLIADLQDKADFDIQQLIDNKPKNSGKTSNSFFEWEKDYYTNILMVNNYNIDEKEVKNYFELNNVLKGLFEVTQKLFGLKYEEIQNPKVWHPEVRMFNCYDIEKNKLIGRFYLDLYPRENKYSHFAMFPITDGKLLENGEYQMPEASLVCNFPKPEGDKPSLMTQYDVSTIFHEFGHLLHTLVANTELAYLAGLNNVRLDFVEAPSQIFENWAFHKESLSIFAKHYKTGEMLPDELLNKIIDSRSVNSGIDALRQMFFATYDLTIHNKYVPVLPSKIENCCDSTSSISLRLKKSITKFDFPEGTHFHASFGHFVGYAAGYYSYMWSKVYAQDMWSVFEKEGPLNSEVGRRYRQLILEPGASEEPILLVKNFLGREPNNKALLKDLGIKAAVN